MERLDDKTKNWKFSSADVKERQFWDEYMKAYADVLTETSTELAHWYLIRPTINGLVAEKEIP